MNLRGIFPLFTIAALVPLHAQDSDSGFDRESKWATGMLTTLFPDCSDPASAISKEMRLLKARLKANGSSLTGFSGEPLVLGFEAAGLLKVTPHWEEITSDQKNEVVNIVAVALVSTHDFDPAPEGNAVRSVDAADTSARAYTIEDTTGKSYWVSQADYARLDPIGKELDQVYERLGRSEASLKERSDRIDLQRDDLDNSDAQAVDDFNAKTSAYNSSLSEHEQEVDDYNTRASRFNSELERVGTLANPQQAVQSQ